MSAAVYDFRGSVAALWRYPIKSVIGEELNSAEVAEKGLVGDHNYAHEGPEGGASL